MKNMNQPKTPIQNTLHNTVNAVTPVAKDIANRTNEELKKPVTLSRRGLLLAVGGAFIEGKTGIVQDTVMGLIDDKEGGDNEPAPPPGKKTDVLTNKNAFQGYSVRNYPLAKQLASDDSKPIPYEVFLAVSMHESDRGRSELAKNANNFFGVIAKDGWSGDTYDEYTRENIPTDKIDEYKRAYPDFKFSKNLQNGKSEVFFTRSFRKYGSIEESFKDFAEKIYYKESDGSYRYSDVVDYLKDGGRDPYQVAYYMSDKDTPDELTYATGNEWRDGVGRYIKLVQKTIHRSSEELGVSSDAKQLKSTAPEPKATFPDKQKSIEVESIDFREFKSEEEKAVAKAMKAAFNRISGKGWSLFSTNGISDESARVIPLVDKGHFRSTTKATEYYSRVYDQGAIDPKYFVIHLWANGMDNGDKVGNSKNITLSDQIMSWARNGSHNNAQYLLSDNPEGELWQLTKGQFDKGNHTIGVADEGNRTHPDVSNNNSVGIEVQADSIFNVTETQFEKLVYWSTKMLLDSGLVKEGMNRKEVNEIVDKTIIGHGKNNGYEFGYKYTRPLISAISQFIYISVNER